MPTSSAQRDLEDQFISDVQRNRANRALLERLHELSLPDAWLVAGCLFQTVWNLRSGQAADAGIRDYDVFYFDADDLSEQSEALINQRAAALFADLAVPIEVKNQARVHLWYEDYFGRPYSALRHSREGIDRFLVASTAVGLQPQAADHRPAVYAPYGLDQLYRGVLTPNPTIDHGPLFERKCRDYQARWPWLSWETNALPPLPEEPANG
ncbi:MAG: nucleotidyltransferase family protein [Rhodoferax sp.]|nr:nucleotidyltransferase family protein [Rhodoferax sp.]